MLFSRAIVFISMLNALTFAAAPVITPATPQALDSFTSIMTVISTPTTFDLLVGELMSAKVNLLLNKAIGDKKVTLLAPTDKALNAFGQIGALRGTPLLEQFLKFHMLEGAVTRKRLRSNRTVKTLSGKTLQTKDIGKISYSIETDNGMIHVLEKVVIHPDVKKTLKIK